MDLYEAVGRRRTIRHFSTPPTEEQLRRILLAGATAPSGGNSQPWEFVVIDDPAILDRLAELKVEISRGFRLAPEETEEEIEARSLDQKTGFTKSAVVAACTTEGQAASGWMAVENMSLAAVAEGLGSGIVTYWGKAAQEVQELLNLPTGYALTCVMRFGVPAGPPAAPARRPPFSWLHKNRF